MDIDLSQYELVSVSSVDIITTDDTETFYDITVDGNHTFLITVDDQQFLTHNCDGHHISGIFFGICYKYLRKMFEERRIYKFITPLVVLFDKKDKPVKYFFNLDDYKNYGNNHNYRVKYFKGLGSWKKEELQSIIAEKGLDFFLQPFVLDEKAEQYLDWWLKTEYTDKRKEFIQEHSLDLELV